MIQLVKTSPQDIAYNCIAWAAEDDLNWWWPHRNRYWPEGAPIGPTLDAFVKAYETRGFKVCDGEVYENGYKKVAIYTDDQSLPQHATRQMRNGNWTSKLGEEWDVEHPFVEEWGKAYINPLNLIVDLSCYGKLKVILKKVI